MNGTSVPNISPTAAGRAVRAAAEQRSVGTPVYLRYAYEGASPASAVAEAAGAVAFAAGVLGQPVIIYATAVRDAAGQIGHLAVAVRHPNGGLSLLGIGTADTARPPTLLFLGDQGAVESNPASFGTLLRDRDGDLAAALRGEEAIATGAVGVDQSLVQAIERSLASGRAEEIGRGGEAGSDR